MRDRPLADSDGATGVRSSSRDTATGCDPCMPRESRRRSRSNHRLHGDSRCASVELGRRSRMVGVTGGTGGRARRDPARGRPRDSRGICPAEPRRATAQTEPTS